MLWLVLGILFFVGVAGIALMALTGSTAKVTTGLGRAVASTRQVDASLELAVNAVRLDDSNVGRSCWNYSFNGLPASIGMRCWGGTATVPAGSPCAVDPTTQPQGDYNNGFRDMVLTACKGGSLVGRARIKVFDRVNSTPLPGYTLQVCDWQIGAALSTGLRACS